MSTVKLSLASVQMLQNILQEVLGKGPGEFGHWAFGAGVPLAKLHFAHGASLQRRPMRTGHSKALADEKVSLLKRLQAYLSLLHFWNIVRRHVACGT